MVEGLDASVAFDARAVQALQMKVAVVDLERVEDSVGDLVVLRAVEVYVTVGLGNHQTSQVANLLHMAAGTEGMTVKGRIVGVGSMQAGIAADLEDRRKGVGREAVGKLPMVVCKVLVKMIHNPHLV